MPPSARDAYLESQVMTATPQKLHLMLIDGAIRFAQQARDRGHDPTGAGVGEPLERCQQVVAELLASVSGSDSEVSRKLASVYLYLFRTLCEVRIEGDPEKLDDVLKVLAEQRATWQAVCDKFGSANDSRAPDGTTAGGAADLTTSPLGDRLGAGNDAAAAGPSGLSLEA